MTKEVIREEDEDEDDDAEEEKVESIEAQMSKLKIGEQKGYTYEQLVEGLRAGAFKNILVMTGAGISVSAGIPDFRSPGTGVYDNLKEYNLPRPEAIFQLDYFLDNPEPFYKFAQYFDMSN